jgi:hypothetical protein
LKQHAKHERSLASAIKSFIYSQIRTINGQIRSLSGELTPEVLSIVFDSHKYHSLLRKAVSRHIVRGMVVGAMTELSMFSNIHSVPISDAISDFDDSDGKQYPFLPEARRLLDIYGAVWKLEALINKKPFPIDSLPAQIQYGIEQALTMTFLQPYWFKINEVTKGRIAAAIKRGVDGRWGKDRIIDEISRTVGGKGARARAVLIARTEMTNAFNAGHLAAIDTLESAGLVDGREWVATQDEATRMTHSDASGTAVSGNYMFNVGGYDCRYPGDYSLPPEERCYCRCTITSITRREDSREQLPAL